VHILYLIDSLAVGGAERSLASMAPNLVTAGVRLDVAYLRERPGVHDALRESGATLFPLDGPGGRVGDLRRVRRVLAERRPDLVHTTLFEADLLGRIAGRLARVPVVSSLVSEGYGTAHVSEPGLRRWKIRAAQVADAATARSVVRFHVPAEHIADTMARRLHVPRDRFDVVPRGRDPEVLGRRSEDRRRAVRARLEVADDVPLVVAIARQEHAKGLDVLVDAFGSVRSEHSDARLLVAGAEGHATAFLRERVSRGDLDGAVVFLGTRPDVPDLLCAADVLVLPSRREGLPGVLLEALALEAPIVASDLPAVREVFDGRDIGLLAKVGDAAGLAAAIDAILADPAEASRRAEHGRERFLARYTAERAARGMFELYERVMSASRRTDGGAEVRVDDREVTEA
jgi:glycosyltransferase involved in cell wall biosynthesis